MKAEDVDCNEHNDHPFCTGDMEIDGLVFCNIYADLTGSRNTGGGGCIERND